MLQQFPGGQQRQFVLHLQQEFGAVCLQQKPEQEGQDEKTDELVKPGDGARPQDPVQKHLGKDREDEAGEDHQQPQTQHLGQGALLPPDALFDQRKQGVFPFGLFKLGGGVEGEHHAGKPLVQVLHGQLAPAQGRVVEVDKGPLKALQHHKMVEVPVDQTGHLQLLQSLRLLAVAVAFQPEFAGGVHDVAGVAAVP